MSTLDSLHVLPASSHLYLETIAIDCGVWYVLLHKRQIPRCVTSLFFGIPYIIRPSTYGIYDNRVVNAVNHSFLSYTLFFSYFHHKIIILFINRHHLFIVEIGCADDAAHQIEITIALSSR